MLCSSHHKSHLTYKNLLMSVVRSKLYVYNLAQCVYGKLATTWCHTNMILTQFFSDSNSTVLVSPRMHIRSDNSYGSWSCAVTMTLQVKLNLLMALGKMSRSSYIVSSWILISFPPEIRECIMYAETAVQIWTDLKETRASIDHSFPHH